MESKLKLFLTLALLVILILGALLFVEPSFISRSQVKYAVELEKNRVLVLALDEARATSRRTQKELNLRLDSLQGAYSALLLKSKSSEKIHTKVIIRYRDSTASKKDTDSVSVAQCDSVVNSAETYISDLKGSVSTCNSMLQTQQSLVQSLRLDTASYISSITLLQSTIQTQKDMIKPLERYKASWWQKNKFWLGVVGGSLSATAMALTVNKFAP